MFDYSDSDYCTFESDGAISDDSNCCTVEFDGAMSHDSDCCAVEFDGAMSDDSDSDSDYCTVEFDGASKGNPGKGGAGAVIRNSSGDVVFRVNKSLDYTTSNEAEYEGLAIGIEEAIEMGYKDVRASGDSQVVCKQVDGSWKVRSRNLREPNRRVNDLIDRLDKFEIGHVPREYNTEADAEANKAVYRRGGKAFKEY